MSNGVLKLVVDSGPVATGMLVVLFLFSVASWAIVGQKLSDLKRVRLQSERFLRVFGSATEMQEVYRASRVLTASPLCHLFRSGYEWANGREGARGDREDLWKLLDGTIADQMAELERYLAFLATVGNVSPFIGLLGTVWGIMDAFMSIGSQGSANLAVVAPGVAEALITTVAGLVAAIPAVIAYNYFLGRIDGVYRQANRFATELGATLLSGGRQ